VKKPADDLTSAGFLSVGNGKFMRVDENELFLKKSLDKTRLLTRTCGSTYLCGSFRHSRSTGLLEGKGEN
jgi:hypothetical protein